MDFNFIQYGIGVLAEFNDIDVNNHLEVVVIHNQLIDQVYYGAGVVKDNEVNLEKTGSMLPFFTLAFNPRICINDNRVVIAAYIGGADPLQYIYYTYGVYSDQAVKWFKSSRKTYCSTPNKEFDTAINDTHFVLAYTYKNLTKDWGKIHSYIKLGKVNVIDAKIDWLDDGWTDIGRCTLPSVSINSAGLLVAAGKSTDNPHNLYCKIGRVANDAVVWDSAELVVPHVSEDNITSLSITLRDRGVVYLAYVANKKSYFMNGMISTDRKKISFHTGPTPFFVGKHGGQNILVALGNGRDNVVAACNDGTAVRGMYVGAASVYSSWMSDNMYQLGNRTLKELILPGSHDAAMHVAQRCTFGARACNTQTQVLNIAEQLQAGIRYFDLRPVLKEDGSVRFSHYTRFAGMRGCDGEDVDVVLRAVSNFATRNHGELIILAISHFEDLQNGGDRFPEAVHREFVSNIRTELAKNLYTTQISGRLADVKLSEFTKGKTVVLPMIDNGAGLPAGSEGVYTYRTRQDGSKTSRDRKLTILAQCYGTCIQPPQAYILSNP